MRINAPLPDALISSNPGANESAPKDTQDRHQAPDKSVNGKTPVARHEVSIAYGQQNAIRFRRQFQSLESGTPASPSHLPAKKDEGGNPLTYAAPKDDDALAALRRTASQYELASPLAWKQFFATRMILGSPQDRKAARSALDSKTVIGPAGWTMEDEVNLWGERDLARGF